MSNDLISRKKALDIIKPRLNSSKEEDLERQRLYSIFTSVKEMPTAYDVDKVVEQMEEIREEILSDTAYDNDTINHYLGYVDLLFETVRAGMKE